MSQIDKLTYLPVLFWFLLFLISFYFAIYSFFLPFILSIAQAREMEYSFVVGWANFFLSLAVDLQSFLRLIPKAPGFLGLSSAQLLKFLSSHG
jgi:hypothetical protein